MAKQKKATSRAAAKTAVRKKWTGHQTAAKSSARKTIKSKGRVSAAKKTTPKAVKSKARPKQRIAISHHREEDFKAEACAPTRTTATSASRMPRTVWRRRM